MSTATGKAVEGEAGDPTRNEVTLWGRLAAAEERTLPSGDLIVTLRIVVPRVGAWSNAKGAPAARDGRAGQVDTIDVVCWTAGTRRAALRAKPGTMVEVEGSLRRRFFGTPAGRQSRYEVEAASLRRLVGGAVTGT